MASSDITILLDMGFEKNNIEKAFMNTGNKGIEAAMEWLLANADINDWPSEHIHKNIELQTPSFNGLEETASSGSSLTVKEEPKSIKCDQCGNLFENHSEIEFHASKFGHDKFSEMNEEKKLLTEEDKRKQLHILENRLRQNRKERAEKQEMETLEKEKNRIRSGKEISQARKRLEESKIKKLLELRKQEKEEDRLTRQRIKEQIEADKIARKLKDIKNDSNSTSIQLASFIPSVSTSKENLNDYRETKLQIRLTNGETMIQNFGSKEQLSAVRLYIEINRTDDTGPFTLMTNFPRKIFNSSDFEMPLDVLGLVPSAVIIVQKK